MVLIDSRGGIGEKGKRKGRPVWSLFLFAFIIFHTPSIPLHAGPAIHYRVSIPDPSTERFHVEAAIDGFERDTFRFVMPVWAPGAYDVVHFGQYVEGMEAIDSRGRSLSITKVDTGAWVIVSPPEEFTLRYRVDDIEELNNSPWFGLSDIDLERKIGFANTSALFGYPEGVDDDAIEWGVTYVPPPGWKIAIALGLEEEKNGAYTYAVNSYDDLVDAPVQMGSFQRWDFEIKGVPHAITITAPSEITEVTAGEIVEMTTKVVTMITDFFGEVPYDFYLFQIYLEQPTQESIGFGALEHKKSSTYLMPWVPQPRLAESLQAVIAHEHWHVWSPKLFHVRTLGPFDYRTPPRTTSLWFHEGLTEYYAHALLVRNGLITKKAFLDDFGGRMNSLASQTQGESIATLSAELPWRNINEVFPLYVKGPVLGLLLDIEIRRQTGNKKSLDDAMRYFNDNYGDHHDGKSFGDDDIVPIIERVTGASIRDFYDRYIAGTEGPPLEEMLAAGGLRPVITPEFGVFMRTMEGGWGIRYIYPGFSADRTGLKGGDIIVGISVDGEKMTKVGDLPFRPVQLNDWLADENRPDIVLHVKRGEEMLSFPLVVQNRIAELEDDPSASAESIRIRTSLYGS